MSITCGVFQALHKAVKLSGRDVPAYQLIIAYHQVAVDVAFVLVTLIILHLIGIDVAAFALIRAQIKALLLLQVVIAIIDLVELLGDKYLLALVELCADLPAHFFEKFLPLLLAFQRVAALFGEFERCEGEYREQADDSREHCCCQQVWLFNFYGLDEHFDSSVLAGKKVVVFEDLYRDDVRIASHADLNDQGQSIVMVTHTIKAAERGNRIIYLSDGVISDECDLGPYVGDYKDDTNPMQSEAVDRHNKLKDFLQDMGW